MHSFPIKNGLTSIELDEIARAGNDRLQRGEGTDRARKRVRLALHAGQDTTDPGGREPAADLFFR